VTQRRKDYWSDGTTISASYLIDWIRENQSACWPERTPMPPWFYPRVAEAIAPTVRDITTRYHPEIDGRPFTAEENREAVARSTTLRILRIWRRIRLGDLVCRRCGGKILGEDLLFDWSGSGPYNVWHSVCFGQQQTDPRPLHLRAPRKRDAAQEYRRELEERKELVRAERHAARLRRRKAPASPSPNEGEHPGSRDGLPSGPPPGDRRKRRRREG
jgi:hypothetical protein